MGYNLDYTNTADLLAAYKTEAKPTTFLKDRYFPDGTTFATDEVLVEYKKGTHRLAPFVSPEINGKIMKREGYKVNAYEPAMLQPKRALSIDTLKKKNFGEALYNGLTKEERAVAITLDDLKEMGDMNTRRKEAMSAEVLQTNALIMKHQTDDNEKPEVKEIAYYEDSNDTVYSPTNMWGTENADIIGDCAAMALSLKHDSLPATDVILGTKAADAFLADPKIQKLLDTRNINIGKFEPEEIYPDVVFLGTLSCKGHKLNFIQYTGVYEDEDGTIKDFIDPKNVIVTAPGCGVTNYGAITQIDFGEKDFKTYVEKEVPLYEVKDQTRAVILKSAPLLQPKNLNPYRVAKVIE